jgi:hypothetical protein
MRPRSAPRGLPTVLLIAGLGAVSANAQQMYVKVGPDGSVTVTDRREGAGWQPYTPGDFERWALKQKGHAHEGIKVVLPRRDTERKKTPYDDLIRDKAERYGVSEALVRAVVAVESGFNARAKSHAGAQGLMQLMPPTAADLGVKDAFDPEQNVDAGTRYLAGLLKTFKREDLALAAYNAGPGRVRRAGGIPRIRETQRYVKRVLALARAYGG